MLATTPHATLAEKYLVEPQQRPSRSADRRRQNASSGHAGTPGDLQVTMDVNPKARAFFATLNSRNRYAILFRIQTAKKAATWTHKIEEFVDMLNRGETIHP